MEAPVLDLRAVRPPKADIQNKENKTCSVCEVTVHYDAGRRGTQFGYFQVVFDLRKAFIEHCQVGGCIVKLSYFAGGS